MRHSERETDMRNVRRIFAITVIMALLTAMVLPAAAQEDDVIVHIVQPGETLVSIAARYGVTVEGIAFYNDLANPNVLQRGQQLRIPPTGGVETLAITGETEVYVVQPGDTLANIATRFNTSVEALMATNPNLSSASRISIGLTLVVPAQGGATDSTTTQTTVITPTTTTVTQTNVVTPTTVIQPVIQPRQVVNGYYRVQAGDTLLAISRDFGVDVWNIARTNGIFNLNLIYTGQLLRIPGYF